jgi:hypothetical protein
LVSVGGGRRPPVGIPVETVSLRAMMVVWGTVQWISLYRERASVLDTSLVLHLWQARIKRGKP